MVFEQSFTVPPLPVDSRGAGTQAVAWTRAIEKAGGIVPVREAAVQRILAASATDPASELLRLWLLYQRAYTREELLSLVDETLLDLGVTGPA